VPNLEQGGILIVVVLGLVTLTLITSLDVFQLLLATVSAPRALRFQCNLSFVGLIPYSKIINAKSLHSTGLHSQQLELDQLILRPHQLSQVFEVLYSQYIR
jgi:hypothetical protein